MTTMKEAKIKFIREYKAWGGTWYDIIYKSGKCYTLLASDIPKTAREFIENATVRREQYDRVMKWNEVIYMMD